MASVSVPGRTGFRIAEEIVTKCNWAKNVDGIDVYKLPLTPTGGSIVNRFSFGKPDATGKRRKTILLMGATGSGKTTMINAMINYVLGVEWLDPFRFMLIDEVIRGGSQAHSQTSEVSVYDIHYQHGFRIPYSLTIIDTPGFGDTEGIERDNEIPTKMKKLFEAKNGIKELDAIGFVVKSTENRLDAKEKYIFNSVLSIFGKNIKDNVRFLVTHADGRPPQVLAAIKEANIPCPKDSKGLPKYNKFNNGALYVSSTSDDEYASMEWKTAMKNFNSFFTELSAMPAQSLQLSQQVLAERELLHMKIEGLEFTIDTQLMKREELRAKKMIIKEHEGEVNANKNFEIRVMVAKKLKEPVYIGAMNCMQCEMTCHEPCNPNIPKALCLAFSSNILGGLFNMVTKGELPTCVVCPSKCHQRDHIEEMTKWVNKQVEETRTLHDIRKKYEDARQKKLSAEELVRDLQMEVDELEDKLKQEVGEITNCLNKLNSIALHGAVLTSPDYIKLMIENQKKNKTEGYMEKIKSLEDLLKIIELAEKIRRGEPVV